MLPYINLPFLKLAAALGTTVDEIKLISSFLLSYPLAGLLKRIPDSKPHRKNLFIIGVSLFYLLGLFDLWSGAWALFISSAGTYVIATYIDGPLMPWIGFAFLMGHMSISHIYRQMVNDPGIVDVTGAQMVLTMKLSALCWNIHDGRLPEKELSDHQKAHALKNFPDLLNYAAYILFFPSLFAGPAFDYVDYRQWIETSMFDVPVGTDPKKLPLTRKKRRIPRSGTPAAIKAATGLLWILAFLKFSGWYTADLILGNQYMKYGFFRRIWILNLFGMTTRMKYYGVWALTEGACILSGIGYNGLDPKTGRPDWNRLQNVNPLGVELAQNTRAYLGNWNINTNNWLRNYVYLRVTPKGKKPGFRASMATFVTSAFWHGFQPGYYLAFVLASFLQTIAKNTRRLVRPFFMSADGKRPTATKRYYDVACWLITQAAFAFTVSPFILLTWKDSLKAWSRVYFYCIIGVILSLIFLQSPAKAILAKKVKARTAGPKLEKVSSHESTDGPIAGLPDDPGQDLDDIMDEVKAEVALRRQRGESLSTGLQDVVDEKLRQLKKARAGK